MTRTQPSSKSTLVVALTAVTALATAVTSFYETRSDKHSVKEEVTAQELWVQDSLAQLAKANAEISQQNYALRVEAAEQHAEIKYLEKRITDLEAKARIRPEAREEKVVAEPIPPPPPMPQLDEIERPTADDPRVQRAMSKKGW